jgi:hypothetical protein
MICDSSRSVVPKEIRERIRRSKETERFQTFQPFNPSIRPFAYALHDSGATQDERESRP